MLKGWSLIFYGTTQPIMKNDPISVPLPSVTNYPSNVSPSKSPGGKGSRKQQQQQQQQKVAPFIILTPPRKGGKAGQKNASGKNGKQKQQQTTTRAPATTLYFNNGRKYEFINGVMSVNRPANAGGGAAQSSTIATQTLKVLNNNVDAAKVINWRMQKCR